jgi:hypothetical protein
MEPTVLQVTPGFLSPLFFGIKVLLYVALYGVVLWAAWSLVQWPKDKPRPNRKRVQPDGKDLT